MNCPSCHRLLYSRTQAKCGYCGAVLPDECLLPAEEINKLKFEKQVIEVRRKAIKEEEKKEREIKKKKRDNFQ